MSRVFKVLLRLNIADWVTISRLIASPLLVILIVNDERLFFSWLLPLAFLTDALDGFLARKLKISSVRGARLDSAADALLFLVSLYGALHFELAFFQKYQMAILIALSFYFVQLGFAYYRYGKSSSFHTYLAKIAAVIQGSFFVVLFLIGAIEWLFYLTLVISIMETIEEILLISILPKWKANVKGIYWVLKKFKSKSNQKRNAS